MNKRLHKVDRQKFLEGDTEELQKIYDNMSYLLKLKRTQRGLTQERAANIVGTSLCFYAQCERGEKSMGSHNFIHTLLLLQIEPYELFGESEKPSVDNHPIHDLIVQLDLESKDTLLQFITKLVYKK